MNIHDALQQDSENGLAVLAFKIQDRQFDLNRDLKYISMKDQIIRGRTLVLGASRAGLIGPALNSSQDESNVIVIGGGIGGISAALAICQLGLKATVIELSDQCFPVLGLGTDRLLSATVYDWPHKHYGTHTFPHVAMLRDAHSINLLKSASVLRFPSMPVTAKILREQLLNQLQDFEKKYTGLLDIRHGHRLDSLANVYLNDPNGSLLVEVMNGGERKILKAQIVIFALGFGLDKSNEQTIASKNFFSYANFQNDIALAMAGNKLVQIIGAGDGGLQEALRFVLSDDYQDFHKVILQLEKSLTKFSASGYWELICAKIQSAEDHASKSLMWGYSEDVVYRELNVIYCEVLDEFLKSNLAAVNAWGEVVLRQCSFTVELVDRSSYSKRVYGLNRFLALILERLALGGNYAKLRRISTTEQGKEAGAVVLERAGFESQQRPNQVGTANAEDLLRRIAFRAVPMNLDTVI